MTKYNVTAHLDTVVVSQIVDLDTDLSPEDEINLAEDTALLNWFKIFDYDFNRKADEITTYSIKES